MKYRHADLIQRIYWQLEAGDSSNYQKVFADLRFGPREFQMEFDFNERKIFWTCFEASRYSTVLLQEHNYVYFYLADLNRDLEFVIPGHTYSDEVNKPILERIPSFHCCWVLGKYFPGLKDVPERPIKIYLQYLRRDWGTINKLNYWFKKMLMQYENRNKAIFEYVDYPKNEKPYKKIVPKLPGNPKT